MKRRALKKFLVPATLTLGLFVYVGSYLWRSTRGRYEPAAIGLNGVKWYSWAPSGYVTDFRWNHTLMLVYCPLYFLDTRFWHTSDEAYGSRYPINQVPTTHGLGISAFAADWPQFRGPTGQGLTDEKALPLEWGGKEKRNVRWQVPLRGQGHASPIVSGDAIFVCTVEWPSNSGPREKCMPAHHVARYRTTDGQLIWDTQVPAGAWLRTDFRSGPGGGYAAPTPATDGRSVFCLFGSSVLAALDFDGKIIWRKEIVPHTFDVTVGSSPVLFRDTVL